MLNENLEVDKPPLMGYEAAADLFRLLAHPVRLAILEILREGEVCVCHIESALGLRQAYVSQQLMFLRRGGVVSMRRQGWNVFYRVNDARIFEIIDGVKRLLPLQISLALPETVQGCTCPRCQSNVLAPKALIGSNHCSTRRFAMLNIKVLGPGCANCQRLEVLTRSVVSALGLQVSMEKVTDFDSIMQYPILATPALVINERVMCSGRLPSRSEIERWLRASLEEAKV